MPPRFSLTPFRFGSIPHRTLPSIYSTSSKVFFHSGRAASCQPSPTGTIPSSTSSKPASIPLRNLIPPTRLSDDEHSLLSSNEKQGSSRRSSDSAGSDFSFFSETGDLAEQLANEEDPLQINLRGSLEGVRPGTSLSKPKKQTSKKIRYVQQDHLERKKTNPIIDKEAIEIPEPAQREISRAECLFATIMTGNRQASQTHGLVGKPLLFAPSIMLLCCEWGSPSLGILRACSFH